MIYGTALTLCFVYMSSAATTPAVTEQKEPEKPVPGSVLELQPYLKEDGVSVKLGDKTQVITLKNLNPRINTWYLLQKSGSAIFHLENAVPDRQTISLAPGSGHLVISSPGKTQTCDFFNEQTQKQITTERRDNRSFTSVCENTVYVRNPIDGRQTAKEFVAEFLRDNIWGGEKITTLVKETIYKDEFLLTSDAQKTPSEAVAPAETKNLPKAAVLAKDQENVALEPLELGIKLETKEKTLRAGHWYAAEAQKGLAVSLYRPDLVPEDLTKSYRKNVGSLDDTEKSALVILVAMDLKQFDIHFAIGTEHPRVGWSERVPEDKIVKTLAGPDGFDTFEPLIGTGKVAPHLRPRVDATFVGGFKRSHGAFKWGELARKNHGSHYGWMEHGVLFSRLQPGLATIAIDRYGKVIMKTWEDGDNESLTPDLRHARQNGVAIIDGVDESGVPVPGSLVNSWGAGNWSGSIDSKQRTLRAALCHQSTEAGDYLIYGYFSSATPNAMARVFQAYQCRYAIHLDMNALEHTYFATYAQDKNSFAIQHLNTGMDVLDSKHKGEALPRFVGQADNRDFFYLLRKENAH